jgi:hypothetical protein
MRISKGYILNDQEYSDATDELKLEYFKSKISKGGWLTEKQYSDMTDNLKLEFIKMIISKGWARDLSKQQYSDAKRLGLL